jgi:hypothetical protein
MEIAVGIQRELLKMACEVPAKNMDNKFMNIQSEAFRSSKSGTFDVLVRNKYVIPEVSSLCDPVRVFRTETHVKQELTRQRRRMFTTPFMESRFSDYSRTRKMREGQLASKWGTSQRSHNSRHSELDQDFLYGSKETIDGSKTSTKLRGGASDTSFDLKPKTDPRRDFFTTPFKRKCFSWIEHGVVDSGCHKQE